MMSPCCPSIEDSLIVSHQQTYTHAQAHTQIVKVNLCNNVAHRTKSITIWFFPISYSSPHLSSPFAFFPLIFLHPFFLPELPYVLNPVWTLCDFATRFHWEVENDLLKHMSLITHSFPKNSVRYDLHPYVVNAGLQYAERKDLMRQERNRVRQYGVGH